MISFFYFEIFCEGEWYMEKRAFYTSNSSLNVCKRLILSHIIPIGENRCSIRHPGGEHLLVPSMARVFLYNQSLIYTTTRVKPYKGMATRRCARPPHTQTTTCTPHPNTPPMWDFLNKLYWGILWRREWCVEERAFYTYLIRA